MTIQTRLDFSGLALLSILLICWPVLGNAQAPVDENGEPFGDYNAVDETTATGNEDIPLLTVTELEELVGPIALYPDDLLAIVLPASAYPLQIVQAGRFLEALEEDPSLKPDESWDDSVVALVNYPEVVELLNDDLDWTWRLGEAVVAQQADVIAAVEAFRDRAYAAGNLKSDDHQTVSHDEGYIEITPVDDDVIYVPYYEPERVVVYQPRPVYYYYPDPCPVYYYPYSSYHAFNRGYFWGVTTAFTIGWHTDRLRVFHHSYRGHPYYGRHYRPRWWYRQPTLNVYNNIYVNRYSNRSRDYYRSGDYWRPRDRRTVRSGDERVTRTRHYPGRTATSTSTSRAQTITRSNNRSRSERGNRRDDSRNDIRFRERPELTSGPVNRTRSSDNDATTRRQPSTLLPRENRRIERPEVRTGRSDVTNRTRRESNDSRRSDARESHQTQARRSDPRETRQAPVRRSEPRRNEVREPRQNQVRRSDPRRSEVREPRQNQVRRSESRRSESAQSQRRNSGSRAKKSGSVKVAASSRKERASNRERRH